MTCLILIILSISKRHAASISGSWNQVYLRSVKTYKYHNTYYFVEVVFSWSSFPFANMLFNFNDLVPYILRYMIYIVLLLHL